jgi:UDP-glucuronate 4-epimerase
VKILVTGGAGFIGSHLVERLLRDGNYVEILDNFDDFYDPRRKEANLADVHPKIAVHHVDIVDAAAVSRVVGPGKFDLIVHLAARAGVRPSIANPALYVQTNIVGTLNLLEAARAACVPRFVFGSSSSVYGLCRQIPFREDVALQETISPYAATKLAGEQLCSNFAHLYGLRVVCLRFFTVFGPRQRPDLAIHQFTERILAGRPIRQFGDGSTRRDYTYVDDIVSGVVASMAYEGPIFDVFNLGGNETTSLSDLICAIEEQLKRKAVIEHLPEQPGDLPLTYADISKARAKLGYAPRTSLAAGLTKFIAWYHDWLASSTHAPAEASG